MRPKIIFGFVILPTVIVLLAVFIKLKTEKPVGALDIASGNVVTVSKPQPHREADASFGNTSVQIQISNSVPIIKELSPEDREKQINTEIDRLNNAYAVRDEASKALIVSDLTNSEPEVRAAAVDATEQLGDRSLIPILQDLATNSTDYEERHALLAAAEFLSLPTMEEAGNTWTPGPNAIPISVARQSQHRHAGPSAPSTAAAPDNSENLPADQPNEVQPATEN